MTEVNRKITGGDWCVIRTDGMEEFDVPDYEVHNDEDYIIFTAHGHPGDGDAECNAKAAALIPQMVTLIRTLSHASKDNFQWMVDEAKRLAAELD